MGGPTVVCAPRWSNDSMCKNPAILSRPNGICYVTSDRASPTSTVTNLHPVANCDGQIYDHKYYFSYAQAGMSVKIVKNFSELIIGAPGIANWKGAVLRYRFGEDLSPSSLDIPCPRCSLLRDNSYLGYSIDYGKFSHTADIAYVSSAPRASDNRGKVLVFLFEKQLNTWRYKVIKEREGTQMGEYFGASLCVTDFNKDGLDDLVVGAPLHSIRENAGDEGCIYVLISSDNGWKDLGERGKIAGSDQAGSRFGTAVALLGDVNMDGYSDIAVGAPYENNQVGSIYIYHGNRNGVNPMYSQKINPSETLFLRGFGASISRGLDIDGNNINDVAVGAYISGHVVIIKAYPVVTILPSFNLARKEIPFTTKHFDIQICFSYMEEYTALNVDIGITLKLDRRYKRASFNASHSNDVFYSNITLEGQKPTCQNISVFIKNPGHFSNPIEIFVKHKLLSPAPSTYTERSTVFGDKSDEFCKHCLITNRSQEATMDIHYVPDSALTDLSVEANFIDVISPYIVGSSNTIHFEVVLQNNGEQAIEPKISVMFPMSLLKMIPSSCQQSLKNLSIETLELICDVKSPFYLEEKHHINFTLDMTEVSPDLPELNIQVHVNSRSLERNETNNKVKLNLLLERFFRLEIHGRSEEYTLVNNEVELGDGEQETIKQKLFKHNYQVVNHGPSPAANVVLYFEIPNKMLQKGVPVEVLSILEPAAYLEQQPLPCTQLDNFHAVHHENFSTHDEALFPSNRTFVLSCLDGNVVCVTMNCTINSLLPRSHGVKVSFSLRAITDKLGPVMGLKDIILIKTFGHIQTAVVKQAEIQSVVWTKPPTTSVDMGMIAICIACGFLILLTFVLLLIKCGFFTRQDPMEKYFRKKAALALENNSIPASTFYSPRGSIMVF